MLLGEPHSVPGCQGKFAAALMQWKAKHCEHSDSTIFSKISPNSPQCVYIMTRGNDKSDVDWNHPFWKDRKEFDLNVSLLFFI